MSARGVRVDDSSSWNGALASWEISHWMSSVSASGSGNGKGGGSGGNAPFSSASGGALSDHLPPQNLDAERSVLGGIPAR